MAEVCFNDHSRPVRTTVSIGLPIKVISTKMVMTSHQMAIHLSDDCHQVVLKKSLLNQLEILDPELPEETLNQVVNTESTPETPVLIKSNRAFHKLLIEVGGR